jgi:hypothetical protein
MVVLGKERKRDSILAAGKAGLHGGLLVYADNYNFRNWIGSLENIPWSS